MLSLGPSRSAPPAGTRPWATLGAPAGRVRNADGSVNAYAVRWDMDTSAVGMAGYTSVTRRFPTADAALDAIEAGMGRAFCATAFDGHSRQIGARRNPKHWRNRRR